MSHILKEYSKNLEVAPSSVHVNKHYYPVIPEKYIAIYNEQDISSKRYLYYSLVIDLVKNQLQDLNINVVLIGSGKNLSDRADYVYPNLSFRENAYIVSKSMLLISVDNALSQYASSQKIKTVCLYGNIYSSITTPYWNKKQDKIDIEPKWSCKPCLSLEDPEDSINKIKAEEVAGSILKLISGGKNSKLNFKTKLINNKKEFCIDVIPTNYVDLSLFKNNVLNIRLDKGLIDDSAFYNYCSKHDCNLVMEDVVIQPSSIKNFSKNIKKITLILNNNEEKIPEDYFSLMKKLGIEFKILVKNKDILDEVRFDYFNQTVELYKPISEMPKGVTVNDYFFSFKIVVEGEKTYKSTHHWKNNLDNSDNIVDNADYWEELDYFYIYEQDRNS